MKRWKLAFCFGFLLLPALLVNPRRVVDFVNPIDRSSLIWTPIDLGKLSPGETHLSKLTLHNDSWRTIRTTPLQTDCGCVIVNPEPLSLPAGSSHTVELSVRAPNSPGDFHRLLTLGAANFPDVVWQVPISGRVEASIWSEPSSFTVELDPGDTDEVQLAIRCKESFNVGKVETSTNAVEIVDSWPLPDGRMVKLEIRALSDLVRTQTAMVQVFYQEQAGAAALEIPIHVRPKSAISFFPKRLDLGDEVWRATTAPVIKKEVVATLLKSDGSSPPRVEPLVAWVEVESEAVTPTTYALSLELDTREIPELENAPILRMSLPNGDTQELSASSL